ncbi:ABC transporter permease [Sinomonas atrocyanea]
MASVPAASATRGPVAARRWGASLGGTGWALFWIAVFGLLVLPIVLFLLVAVSPALFEQGPAWFTLDAFGQVWTPTFLPAVGNTLLVGTGAGAAATVLGAAMAWTVNRTDVPLRPLWSGSMFALLLAPSYLIALGWERLLEPGGVLDVLGVPDGALRALVYGPVGVTAVLAVKGLPFAYLAVSGALRGLGDEFAAAARVHGGGPVRAAQVTAALLAPAVWSSFAIVFAESISDFGVAATLANDAKFPIATYTLYNAVQAFPVDFPVAAAVGWVLLAMAGLAVFAQHRALRGRSYRVLSGRSRRARRHVLGAWQRVGTVAALLAAVLVSLGVPVFGALSASVISGLGTLDGSHGFTLDNYARVVASPALHGPLVFSVWMAAATATAAVLLAAVAAWLLSGTEGRLSRRVLDLLLLTAVALPGIVFSAGYIFTYNLPIADALGIHLYGTPLLLLLGYIATALPSTTRLLVGTVGQVQASLPLAARAHGAGPIRAWTSTALPLLARPLISAWLLTFGGTLLELPVSELLYPPGQPPVAIGITKALSNYDYGGGTAMEVLAVLLALAVMGLAWGLWALLAPAGWRRIGTTA